MSQLFYLILWHLTDAIPQINLYQTDRADIHDRNGWQHSCLHTIAFTEQSKFNRQITSFCMSESPSKFPVEIDVSFPRFTFAELSKHNITSRHLYRWSASIDVIERYQLYLDQISLGASHPWAAEIFYNCTLPRFGPNCQYELDIFDADVAFVHEMIDHYYNSYDYSPANLTCYTHLQCNRGPDPACLDWTEICDGHVDCLDGDFDEQHCWQLEINECQADEFRCANGQCIPQSFYKEKMMPADCMDTSDELPIFLMDDRYCDTGDVAFRCEDMACGPKAFGSSCMRGRDDILLRAMFSDKDRGVGDDCWTAFKCLVSASGDLGEINTDFCKFGTYAEIIERSCPSMLLVPAVPIIHNQIYFAYEKADAKSFQSGRAQQPYLCYHDAYYDRYFSGGVKISLRNMTCYRNTEQAIVSGQSFAWNKSSFHKLYRVFRSYNLIYNYTPSICHRPNMYQCENSLKCISIHRLYNDIRDCPMGDDEKRNKTNSTTSWQLFTDINEWVEDEEKIQEQYIRYNISFQTICDGFTELMPVTIDEQNETDETECRQWQCDNIYTRCDGLWNCRDGADELGCDLTPPLSCPIEHHVCVSLLTNNFTCLPIARANDGIVDCLGGMDEPLLCRSKSPSEGRLLFQCVNTENVSTCLYPWFLCNGRSECYSDEDEQFCTTNQIFAHKPYLCESPHLASASNVEQFVCQGLKTEEKAAIVSFTLEARSKPVKSRTQKNESSSLAIQRSRRSQPRCHHGLDVRVWLNQQCGLSTKTCLCPPNFYGDTCQFQNQRVSLALRFRALSGSWETPFTIVVSLIDDSNQRTVHSFERITYLSMKDCTMKYDMYLLYSTRPKDSTKQYFIQIDLYEKLSLTHRGSLLYPVAFPFLPVHRLAFVIDIPRSNDNIETCSNLRCIHGECVKYANHRGAQRHFCRCHVGWTGWYCTIAHQCTCSADSLCVGVAANNRSICICPAHKFGPRCRIDSACRTGEQTICQNGGQCIPIDELLMPKQRFICICQTGFSGERCEIEDNKLVVSFADDVPLSQSIFIHFLRVVEGGPPVRATTLRTLLVQQESLIVQWSQPFHLVFVELANKNYYQVVVQSFYNQSATIATTIDSSHRCQHISELFNDTFVHLHLLRRIKYYHLPCQNPLLNVSCFFDETHLCTCYNHGQRRLANCLAFNHHMIFDCFGQSECENGGRCFQDASHCPQRSMCVCPPCFYGGRCQFSTNGFGSSLDAILGYHIQPNVSLARQPGIVKASVILTIIFLIAGLTNGCLAILTFKHKNIREVGCGLYLYTSSIAALWTIIMFGLKFWILLLAQMKRISSRGFLSFQCHTIDVLLRICLNMDQWLSACVAFERVIIAKRGVSFNKKKSIQAAKIVIAILFIINVATSIHDPLNRRLIVEQNDDDDNGEKRIWCIVTYSDNVHIFNSIMYSFHLFGPFVINFVSGVILVSKKSRRQMNLDRRRRFRQFLQRQLRRHQHLFTAPILLVILALPRLVIAFVSKCMKSANDSWLFLIGYFISFIPSMLSFVIFVLPSNFYKQYFHSSVAPYPIRAQSRLPT